MASCEKKDNKKNRFEILEFSEYYKECQAFQELEPLLRSYFEYIEEELKYAKKDDLNSFSLPTEFYSIQEKIETLDEEYSDWTINEKSTEEEREEILKDRWGIYSSLMIPYHSMQVHLACGDFFKSALPYMDNPEKEVLLYFEKTEKLLDEIYKVYEDENNKISDDYYFKDENY